MVKAKNLKQVPKLRFPGFKGEWERGVLSEIANINPKSKALPKEFIYIDLESVTKGNFSEGLSINRDEAPSRAQRVMEKCDILYQTVRPYQRNNLFFNREGNYVASTGYAQIRAKGEPLFLYQLLHTTPFVNTAMKWSTGTSYPAISSFDLVKIPISCPTLPEQEKIASFLSAVDKKVQQLTAKKELLEQYKKGVMQKIFSQEIRFTDDDGKDYPDWEEKKLGDICEIVGGGTPETSTPEYWNGKITWFTPTEIQSKYIAESKRTISKLGLKSSSARLLPAGTILFTSRATVAEASFAMKECTTNQGFQSIIVDARNDAEFVYYLIKQNKKEFIRKAQGSTFLEISKNEMKKIKVLVPTLLEQKEIGLFLSQIDQKIEAVQSQLTQTQTFKKGLLQQLFV